MGQLQWQVKSVLHRIGLWTQAENLRARLHFLRRKPHEDDFRIFEKLSHSKGLFLDIGANAGQSARSFAIFNDSFDIVSFEPNNAMKSGLQFTQSLLGKRFSFLMKGVGSEPSKKKLYVPEVSGVPFTQEATFKKELLLNDVVTISRIRGPSRSEKFDIREFDFEIVKLDDYRDSKGEALRPDVVKMDTQGFEVEALKGMVGILKNSKPLLMIENGSILGELRDFLAPLGYSAFAFCAENNSLSPLTELEASTVLNVFFLHQDKRLEFKNLLNS